MKLFTPSLLALAVASASTVTLADEALPVVSVTADFRAATVFDIGSSLSIIDAQSITQRNAEHLEEVLNLAPNVNFSSGASRARFFQIRGIGERSQFEKISNPSVGVLIDDVDFTGIGNAGTLLDVEQVEVLRGPQGTRYGANALAGLINIKTKAPTETYEGSVKTTVADYGSYNISGVVSGPINDDVQYRLAAQKNISDGYIENDYLARKDTNNIDEETLRGKLRWKSSDELTFDFTALYVNIDNGYDAFSLDNTRTTLSDQPGVDRQEATALSVTTTYEGSDLFTTEILTSYANSDSEYGYDEDWANADICAGLPCAGTEYSSKDNYIRDRKNDSLEVRLISKPGAEIFNGSTQWVTGLYYSGQNEGLLREYTYASSDFSYDYGTNKTSGYIELETELNSQLILTTGYRLEHHSATYQDNNGANFGLSENLWGGKLALEYLLNDDTVVYSLISRGYKTGGVNSNPDLHESYREFDTEFMINYEIGTKSSLLDDRLHTQIALFYQTREDIQVSPHVIVPNSAALTPGTFISYTDNAASGINYGLEAEFQWQTTDALKLSGSLGLLNTEFQNFVNADGKDLDGRDQAHAPSYQFALATQYDFTSHLSARLEV